MTADWLQQQFEDACELHQRVRTDAGFMERLGRICESVVGCFKNGGKLLAFGNGGSATDAVHLTEELIGRYRSNRPALPAVCLSVDGPALTCIANDFGYESVFSRQIEALCRPGDVVVAFSTSGKSESIIAGLEAARERGGLAIGVLGCEGGAAVKYCDLAVVVPHQATARIQEVHTLILHAICEAVEREFR